MEELDINQLNYFLAVVEESTFTAAASKMLISQPSLSTSIKKLENELGLVLLDRKKGGLRLTKEGKILYEEAKRLVLHHEHVNNEMIRLKQEGPLRLSFGIIESTKFWFPHILLKIREEYESVRIKISEVLSLKTVEKSLYNFDVDLAITNQYINDDNIACIPIYDEKLVALIPENHPLGYKSFITVKDLEDESFIISEEGFQTRDDILKAFSKSGIKPKINYEIGRFETACDLVEEGLGITVVPENYVKNLKETKYMFKSIHDPNVMRTVYLVYDKTRYNPPIVLRSIELIKEHFKN